MRSLSQPPSPSTHRLPAQLQLEVRGQGQGQVLPPSLSRLVQAQELPAQVATASALVTITTAVTGSVLALALALEAGVPLPRPRPLRGRGQAVHQFLVVSAVQGRLQEQQVLPPPLALDPALGLASELDWQVQHLRVDLASVAWAPAALLLVAWALAVWVHFRLGLLEESALELVVHSDRQSRISCLAWRPSRAPSSLAWVCPAAAAACPLLALLVA